MLQVQIAPSSLWAEAMHVSGFFPRLLNTLIEDDKAKNTLILVDIIQLFARIIMKDVNAFFQLVAAAAGSLNKTESYLLTGFLDQWWAKVISTVFNPIDLN